MSSTKKLNIKNISNTSSFLLLGLLLYGAGLLLQSIPVNANISPVFAAPPLFKHDTPNSVLNPAN